MDKRPFGVAVLVWTAPLRTEGGTTPLKLVYRLVRVMGRSFGISNYFPGLWVVILSYQFAFLGYKS